MSDELLTKENRFYELNVELERKAKELMKEVNSVVNTRLFDNNEGPLLSDGRISRVTSFKGPRIKNGERCNDNGTNKSVKYTSKYVPDSAIKDFKSDVNLQRCLTKSKQCLDRDISEDDGSYDETFDKAGKSSRNDAVVRFFKSKAKILETELETIKLEYKRKCDYSEELRAENKRIDEERVKFHGQLTAIKETLARNEATNNAQFSSLQRTENQNTALKKEIDALKKDLKVANQNSNSYSIRLNRSVEDNDRLRKALKCSQLEEKELRDENRKLEEEKKVAVANLEKQRAELLHAFKKQILLVDNLKKQKAHLEANLLIKYTEEELLKLLDWKPDEVQ